MQTYLKALNLKNVCQIYFSSVWVRLSIFSPLSIMQYVGLYVFSLSIYFMMIERIYILCRIIIIKSEAWTITHCFGLGHETMVSAVYLSIFLWEGVSHNDLWPWPISSRLFSCDIPYFMDYINMCHKYNPWGDNVSHIISRSKVKIKGYSNFCGLGGDYPSRSLIFNF